MVRHDWHRNGQVSNWWCLTTCSQPLSVSTHINVARGVTHQTGGSAFADLSTGKKNDSPPPLRAGSEVVAVALTFAEDLNSKNIEGIHNVNSTKEANVCADRGMCNGNTGQCECFLGFKMGSMHGTGACDTIEGHTALRGDGVPLTRKMEFKGT